MSRGLYGKKENTIDNLGEGVPGRGNSKFLAVIFREQRMMLLNE